MKHRRPVDTSKLPNHLIEWNSWGEMLEYVAKTPTVSYQGSRMYGEWFSGTSTFEEAVELATNGWDDAAQKARVLSEALFDKVSSLIERETVVYDVEGLDIDMAAYLRGEPECWMRFEKHMEEDDGSRIVKIVVNVTASAMVDKESIVGRGAAVAALIELLEYSGIRTEVICHAGLDNEIHFRTLIKTADQPLDMGRMMYATGHPSMLRRLMFAALEQNPESHKAVGSGYGTPANAHGSLQGDVYLGRMYGGESQWTDTEAAQAWVINELRSQGIEIKAPQA